MKRSRTAVVPVKTARGTSSSGQKGRQEGLGNEEGEEDHSSLGFLWLGVTKDKW